MLYCYKRTFDVHINFCHGGGPGMDTENKMDLEHFLMVKAAWYYYIEDYTQQTISQLLGVSRGKVIALLERARQTGLIQFSIRSDSDRRMSMEQEMARRFHLKDVFLVPAEQTLDNPKESIAQAAAMYILHRAEDGAYINIGYGDTTSRVLNHLATAAERPLNVVSMTGGVNYYLPTDHPSNVFNARLYLTPSPLLLSSAELRDAMAQEPDVREVSRMVPLSSMSVVGIGHMGEDATIIHSGVLTKNDFTVLKMQGAVGDILSHFLDETGKAVAPNLESRLMSTPLEQLKKLKNVIGVAGGLEKVEVILAVLQGGYLDVLITDERTAQALLERSNHMANVTWGGDQP